MRRLLASVACAVALALLCFAKVGDPPRRSGDWIGAIDEDGASADGWAIPSAISWHWGTVLAPGELRIAVLTGAESSSVATHGGGSSGNPILDPDAFDLATIVAIDGRVVHAEAGGPNLLFLGPRLGAGSQVALGVAGHSDRGHYSAVLWTE